jgi:hypothetical protein
MQKVDHATVKALELKAPGVSLLDSVSLYKQIQSGEIFSAFSQQDRQAFWVTLQSFDGLIPSLFTFFEDFKYIQRLADCAKKLVAVSKKATISSALERSFSGINQKRDECIIQKTESVFYTKIGTITDRVDLGRRQIFLYIMRHLEDLAPGSTRLEARGTKITKAPSKQAWYKLAILAEQLGFESVKITDLKSTCSNITDTQSGQSEPSFVVAGPGENLERRCGRPFDLAYAQSKDLLFLDNMHRVDKTKANGITPFFVRRSVYFTFFGRLTFNGMTLDYGIPPPDPPSRSPRRSTSQIPNPTLPQLVQGMASYEMKEAGQLEDIGHTLNNMNLIRSLPPNQELLFAENDDRLCNSYGGQRSIVSSSHYLTDDEEPPEPVTRDTHHGWGSATPSILSSSDVGFSIFGYWLVE